MTDFASIKARRERNTAERQEAENQAIKAAVVRESGCQSARILQLMGMANRMGVDTYVSNSFTVNVDGNETVIPRAVFKFECRDGDEFDANWKHLNFLSEPWEWERVQHELIEIENERRERVRKLTKAREAYDSLDEEQRAALGLTRRP